METVNHERYAYVETHSTNLLHNDPQVVGQLSARQAIFQAEALGITNSAEFIRREVEKL